MTRTKTVFTCIACEKQSLGSGRSKYCTAPECQKIKWQSYNDKRERRRVRVERVEPVDLKSESVVLSQFNSAAAAATGAAVLASVGLTRAEVVAMR